MKRIFKPLMFLFFAAAIVACSKDDDPGVIIEPEGSSPLAKFEVAPGDDPFTFKFTNMSEGFEEAVWRFGDDSVAYDANPEHVYMTTGTFQVTMTVTSESGKTSQYLREIEIDPNDFISISAEKTATPNKLQFRAETELDVDNVEWRIVDNTRPTPAVATSPEMAPVLDVPPGQIAPVRATVTTKKGSVAVINRDASTEGIVTNFMDLLASDAYVGTENNTSNANETYKELFDPNNDNKGKFLIPWSSGKTWNIVMDFKTAQPIKFYSIANGNDSHTRSPKSWTIEGSNDGTTWTVLDAQTLDKHWHQQLVDRGFQNNNAATEWKKFYYPIANPGSYRYFKLNVTANFGATLIQFGELIFFK